MATEVDNADQMQSSNEATDKEKPATDLAGSNPLSEEEMAESEAYRVELSTRYGQLDALLLGNENPSECADFPPFAKNDSSLKRNTAFVKKLKNYTESQRDAIMRELPALNLSKYLEEVANALLEAKLKSSDLSSILLINCLLARNYAEYAELALDAWRKVLLPKQQQPKESQQNQWNLAKLRVDLRLYSDLIFAKVLPTMPALKLLGQCLQALTLNDADFSHCGLVCHLLSHSGDSLIGQLPTRKLALANRCSPAVELPRGTHYLEAETKRPFYRLLTEYGKRLTSSLTDRAGELSRMDRQNRRILNSKGELSQDRRDAFETCKKEVDRLLGLANQLCNLLGEPAPELPPIESDDLDEEERAVADSLSAPAGAGRLPGLDEASGVLGRFEDEDARAFYETLPDLRPMLPEVLVREAKERMETAAAAAAATKQKTEDSIALKEEETERQEDQSKAEQKSESAEADTEAAEDDEAALERELLEEEEQQAAAAAAPAEPDSVETTDATSTSATAQQDDDEESAVLTSQPAAPAQTQTQRQAQLEQFLTALPTLVNRDMIDKAAVEFATGLNSKSARRRLSHAMLTVHRSRSDLLPFYARLAAVLQPVAPEVAQELRQRLQADFRHAFHKKDHTNLESKLKTVRFIGELVKFGLFPLADAAADLKLLIINFSHHSIELACTLLESCGRYLYATPETHLRIKVYLRNLWNKKTKMVTDERLSAMIENAYYSVAPPDANSRRLAKVVLLPPMMQFLQRLLFKDLCNSTVEKVLNLCLRLPWTDPEISQFAVRCFTSVWCIPYSSVHCLASVLAGLAPYQPSVAIAVVDNVLEDIRLGMEINETRLNQRRIACSRYLGELYNYCLVESGLIFNTLHSFISFGVDLSDPTAPEQSSPPPAADYISLDPPEHLLRIRLSCVLLQTCGQYFDTGSNKKRLDAYLLYLQQYYWSKRRQLVWSSEDRPFPLDIEYLYTETVDSLRPKFKHANNFQEARLFVDKQEKAFLAKLERVAAKLQQQSDTAARGQLTTIVEASGAAGATSTASGTSATEDEDDEDDDDDEEDGDDERGGGKRRSGGRNHRRDDAGTDGDNPEGEDDADRASSNSATPQRRQSPRPELMACPEDEEFIRAFERTLAVEGGGGVGSGVGGGVGGPPGFLSASGDPNSVACASNSPAADAPAAGTVAFTVMARRGGNSRNQPVVRLPADSHLARRYLAAVEADAREREAVKRATLSITEAQMRRDEAADEAAAAAAIADAEVPHLIGHRQRGGGGGRWQLRQGGAGRY
ncbi:hypothetical protein BOX15_Mlig018107g5 [Macrostomum lignano]|uniref:MIF4G domain-containing protein n=1 Tax=Macrostomum lignano TaxID=282301 RepID=A0A267H7B1_9PLAT|nr:hypothetical protein BOX15_Mlig018107g5 [Macrostomum lignano]